MQMTVLYFIFILAPYLHTYEEGGTKYFKISCRPYTTTTTISLQQWNIAIKLKMNMHHENKKKKYWPIFIRGLRVRLLIWDQFLSFVQLQTQTDHRSVVSGAWLKWTTILLHNTPHHIIGMLDKMNIDTQMNDVTVNCKSLPFQCHSRMIMSLQSSYRRI